HPLALQRYALAVLSHIGLIVAWYLFVKLGDVPKFVMPSPYETVRALLVPNYRWAENIAGTGTEIFAGYHLPVVFRLGGALLCSWCRGLVMAVMPLRVSLNMIPKGALGPPTLLWFNSRVGTNEFVRVATWVVPIGLTPARGKAGGEPHLLDLVHTLKG